MYWAFSLSLSLCCWLAHNFTFGRSEHARKVGYSGRLALTAKRESGSLVLQACEDRREMESGETTPLCNHYKHPHKIARERTTVPSSKNTICFERQKNDSRHSARTQQEERAYMPGSRRYNKHKSRGNASMPPLGED